MQPEVQAALIAAIAALIVSLVNANTTQKTKTIMLEVKNQLLGFENTFVDRLNGRYIRKPDLPDDYPMTRREGEAIAAQATAAAEISEKNRTDVDRRFDEIHRHINRSAKAAGQS